MATMDLRYLVYAPLIENEIAGTFTYGVGKVAAKAIKVDTKLNIAYSPLYADGVTSESAKELIDGTVTVNADDLSSDVRKDWLGNSTETETIGTGDDTVEVEVLNSSGDDEQPYFGFGYYTVKKKNNVRLYRAVILVKVQFAEPDEANETKGQQINWQTPVVNGTIMRRADDRWKQEITVTDRATAIAWLNSKLNITNAPALALSGIVPTDGATSVSRSTTVVLTFNTKIASEAVTLLNSTNGDPVDVTKSWDADHKILTLTPSTQLAATTKYIVDVTGVTDIYNRALAAVGRDFTTGT